MRHESIKKLRRAIVWGVCGFLSWLAYCAAVWLLVGCKSIEYVPVIEHRTDTVIKTHQRLDSIYVHDSTYIHERGDTVWIERWHTRWRDRLLADTIYQSTHDTIPKPYVMLEYTDKPLTWWQQTRIYMGNIAILAGIVILIILYVKPRIKP